MKSTTLSTPFDPNSPQLINTNFDIHLFMVQRFDKPYKQVIKQEMDSIFDKYKNQKPMVHLLAINNGKLKTTVVEHPINMNGDHIGNPFIYEKVWFDYLLLSGLIRTDFSESDNDCLYSFYRCVTGILRCHNHALVVTVDGYICRVLEVPAIKMPKGDRRVKT